MPAHPRNVVLIADSGPQSDLAKKKLEAAQINYTVIKNTDDPAAARYKCPTLLIYGKPYIGLEAIGHGIIFDYNLA